MRALPLIGLLIMPWNAIAQSVPPSASPQARLPDDMRDTAFQAAELFKNQKYDEAAAKYQSIINKYPNSLYAWSNLGVVRFQQGDFGDAQDALEEAVKLSPTDAFSQSNLGIVYYQLKRYDDAIDALNSAKALNPNDPKTHNYLGLVCSRKGWIDPAMKEFLKTIELDPNFGDAHFNLAVIYASLNPPLLKEGRNEYHRAIELGVPKDLQMEQRLQISAPAEVPPSSGGNRLDEYIQMLSDKQANYIKSYHVLSEYQSVDIELDSAFWDGLNHDQQLRLCDTLAKVDFLQKMKLVTAHLYVDSTEVGTISPNMFGGGNSFSRDGRYWNP